MTFREWMTAHYTSAREYHNRLKWTYETATSYCTDAICEQKHIDLIIQLLREIQQPSPHGKYDGTVTDEDKEWYREHGIINNERVLNDYINLTKKLLK